MNDKDKSSPSASSRAWHGFMAGVYSGVLFSVASFFVYAEETSPYIFGLAQGLHAYAYTVAVYALLAGALGLVLGILLWLPGRIIPPLRRRLFWVLLILPFAALVPFAFVNARWQINVPRNVALYDPYRIAFIQKSLLICAAIGLAVAIVLTLVFYGRACRRWGRKAHVAFVIAAVAVAALTWTQMHLLHGRVDWTRVDNMAGPRAGDLRVIFVGLDGATWTVLAPMLAEGKLPEMKRFLEESAYGPIQVYGKAFSPSVWTTMATGVKRNVHGIVSYTVSGEEGTYMAGSHHRKVPALWNIANKAGLATGLINYMVAYPPEQVLGINLTRMVPVGAIPYEEKVWPPSLIPEVTELIESVPPAEGADQHARDLNYEIAVLTELFKKYSDPAFSFFTVYTHSTDDVEHRYWSFMYPEDFEGTPLEPSEADIAAKSDVIRDHWENVEGMFAHLNSIEDANTVVIVASDHGMESATAPECHLAVNDLLAEMGLLTYTASAEIDTSATLAYWPRGSDTNMGATGIQINRTAVGSFPGAGSSYDEALDYVMEKLRAVRLKEAGRPLFPAVHTPTMEKNPAFKEPLARSDVIIHLSAYTRGAEVDDVLAIGDRTIPLTDVLAMKGDVTGAHHPRGTLFARGLPFKRGPVFTRPTVETPLSDVMQRVLGRKERLDPIMSCAKALGIVDRATTLDLCQTMLYLLGLPCADYMQGRVLVEGMDRGYVADHPGLLITDYGAEATRADRESAPSSEELERLRSLGYVD